MLQRNMRCIGCSTTRMIHTMALSAWHLARIESAARTSILRAMSFATLAITMVMVGLSYDPASALKSGGILFGIAALVLYLKAMKAPSRDFRRTEVYLILDGDLGMGEREAQSAISSLLQRIYQRFAIYSGYMASGLVILSLFA